MTFPIDVHRHPKISRLPVEVRWAFLEMNGEARLADNDGVFDAEEAEFMWGVDVLDALVGSHPSKPLVIREGGTYRLREYAKHQQTKADRDELSRKRAEAARKRWGDASNTDASAMQVHTGSMQTSAQSESQSQLQDLLLTESVTLGSNRAREPLTDSEKEAAGKLATSLGVDLRAVQVAAMNLDRELNEREALSLASFILQKSKRTPRNPMGYVMSAFRANPLEVQQWIDREVCDA